jgi:hypothetical protein
MRSVNTLSETLADLERRLGERVVTFVILDTARANGLSVVERAHIDRECDKILREVDALYERIATARRAPVDRSVSAAVTQAVEGSG